MSVHYKFKAAVGFDTVQFDGLHISVADLKRSIILQKKLGKATDFDLQITNAQTKEEYTDETSLIPKNTSVLVARVPLSNTQLKKVWEPTDVNVTCKLNAINDEQSQDISRITQSVDLTTLDVSEEEKIKAMMTQSTQDYDPSKYLKIRGSNQYGPVPNNYRCYKCHQPGHWIKNCPLNQVDFKMEIKKSTGIPRSFMVPVEDPRAPGALMTSTGHFAVPKIDHEAYKEGKKEKPPFIDEPAPVQEKQDIPQELLCNICKDLLSDAVLIPCCGNSYCDECIRLALLDSEEHECPDCHEKDVSPDTLIPNRFLRTAVHNFGNETGYVKVKRGTTDQKDGRKEKSIDAQNAMTSVYDRISPHAADERKRMEYGKNFNIYGDGEGRAGTPTVDEEPLEKYSCHMESPNSRSQRTFSHHYSHRPESDRRRHKKISRDISKGTLPPVPSYDHHVIRSNILPLISEPAPPGVDIAPIPDVHRPPPPLIMPPLNPGNRCSANRSSRQKFKSYGVSRYDIPGTIDDPLEAFERIMRERDERDRKIRKTHRSRSRSGSYKNSESSGSWKHSPGRSRSRSPKSKRRRMSRSWSRSHSFSPRREYPPSPRHYFGETSNSPDKGYLSNYPKSIRMYDNRRSFYTEELYREQYRCMDMRSYDFRNEFSEYKNYRNPADEAYLDNGFSSAERRHDFLRNHDTSGFSSAYNADYYREYDLYYARDYQDYRFSRHKDYAQYTVSYPLDQVSNNSEKNKRDLYKRDEKRRSSDRRSRECSKVAEKRSSSKSKQASKSKRDKKVSQGKAELPSKTTLKHKANFVDKSHDTDISSAHFSKMESVDKKAKTKDKKRRKKQKPGDASSESDKNKKRRKKDKPDKHSSKTAIIKEKSPGNNVSNDAVKSDKNQKVETLKEESKVEAKDNNVEKGERESDDVFSCGSFVPKQLVLNKTNPITIILKDKNLIGATIENEEIADENVHHSSLENFAETPSVLNSSSAHDSAPDAAQSSVPQESPTNEVRSKNSVNTPEPSKWEKDDSALPAEDDQEHPSKVNARSNEQVSSEVLRRAEKAVFEKSAAAATKTHEYRRTDKKPDHGEERSSEHRKQSDAGKSDSERRKIDRSKFSYKETRDKSNSLDEKSLQKTASNEKPYKKDSKVVSLKKNRSPDRSDFKSAERSGKSKPSENTASKSPPKSRKTKPDKSVRTKVSDKKSRVHPKDSKAEPDERSKQSSNSESRAAAASSPTKCRRSKSPPAEKHKSQVNADDRNKPKRGESATRAGSLEKSSSLRTSGKSSSHAKPAKGKASGASECERSKSTEKNSSRERRRSPTPEGSSAATKANEKREAKGTEKGPPRSPEPHFKKSQSPGKKGVSNPAEKSKVSKSNDKRFKSDKKQFDYYKSRKSKTPERAPRKEDKHVDAGKTSRDGYAADKNHSRDRPKDSRSSSSSSKPKGATKENAPDPKSPVKNEKYDSTTDKRKNVIDESNFEPDYDGFDSGLETENRPVKPSSQSKTVSAVVVAAAAAAAVEAASSSSDKPKSRKLESRRSRSLPRETFNNGTESSCSSDSERKSRMHKRHASTSDSDSSYGRSKSDYRRKAKKRKTRGKK